MKALLLAAGFAIALAMPHAARADSCEKVLENVDDEMTIASVAYALRVEELSKKKPGTDAERATFLNKLCLYGGEILGTQRGVRALSAECLKGADRRKKLGTLDDSIKNLEATLKDTCG